MIAVIKGDIINSRKIKTPERWLLPLKKLLSGWGETPQQWELVWGDFFQLEVADPYTALEKALQIKALIKCIAPDTEHKKSSPIDVRLSLGIGKKDYTAQRISESNGAAFIYSGERFETLKKEKISLAIQTAWSEFDDLMNLYLKLTTLFMDNWTRSSAELVSLVFLHPDVTQETIGSYLGIKQNSVSGRWRRAYVEELLQVNAMYKRLLKKYLP